MANNQTSYQSKRIPTDGIRYGQTNQKSVSIVTMVVVVIVTMFVTFIVYKNTDNIKGLFGSGTGEMLVDSGVIHVGDNIKVAGLVTSDGDLVSYTHRLHTAEYGSLGIKSSTINLNEYSDQIEIEGIVEKIQGGIYVVEVSKVRGERAIVQDTGVNNTGNIQGQYIKEAGLYFSPELLYTYSIDDQTSDSIKLTNTVNEAKIEISFFTCTKSDPNKNCVGLRKNFSGIGDSFTAGNGLVFYKLTDVNTRFFSNEDYWGYFINDASKEEVIEIAKNLQVPNKSFFEDNVSPYVPRICSDGQNNLDQINSSTIKFQGGGLYVDIKGKATDGDAACTVLLDPSAEYGAQMTTFNVEKKDVIATGNSNTDQTTTDASDASIDINVPQFPINIEKAVQFKSSRGHTITFPAGNVTWRAGKAEDQSLGQAGVNCYNTLNVTKYSKENPEIAAEVASIRVHECSIKKGFTESNLFRHIEAGSGKNFIIEVVDPSWKNFSDNVVIE